MTAESVASLGRYTREQLLRMAECARALARPEAAAEVARVCEEMRKS
jgi:UDP-N-acetylglucosamine--N-acetylmuramyl-(pentapeptide) pyrophosphoryl-undecaprenol N-acetylglucosamine transferase